MNFQLQQKSMTLNDLERQFTALSSVYECMSGRACDILRRASKSNAFCDKTAEARIMLYSL